MPITPKLPLRIEDSEPNVQPNLFENIIMTHTDTHTPTLPGSLTQR